MFSGLSKFISGFLMYLLPLTFPGKLQMMNQILSNSQNQCGNFIFVQLMPPVSQSFHWMNIAAT